MKNSAHISNRNLKKRSEHGSVLIEGVAGILLITIGLVLCVAFLMNVGFSSYYKERLGFAVDQTARFAAHFPDSDKAWKKHKVEQYALDMMKNMGFGNQHTTVKSEEIQLNGEDASAVEISSDFPICQQMKEIFPDKLALTERSVALKGGAKLAGYLRYSISTQSGVQDQGTQSVASGVGAYSSGGVMVPIVKVKGMQMGKDGSITGTKPIVTAASIDKNTQALSPCIAASRDVLDPNQTAKQGIGSY